MSWGEGERGVCVGRLRTREEREREKGWAWFGWGMLPFVKFWGSRRTYIRDCVENKKRNGKNNIQRRRNEGD